MTFAALLATLPRPLAELRELWLVLPADVAANLASKQAAHGSPVHRVEPVAGPASDPRFALCADLVSEIGPGGLHAGLFAHLDAAKFATVEILDTATLRAAGWFAPAATP